jgi:Flp pilus assembly protein TadG
VQAMNNSTTEKVLQARKAAAQIVARWRGDQQGSSMIEFAMVLPVMLMAMMGIAAFGMAMNNYTSLTNATGVAARQLALSRGNTTDPCKLAATATYNAAPLLTQSSLVFVTVINGTRFTGNTCSSSSTTTGAAGDMVQGTTVTFTVTYPCSLSIYGKNYAPSCTLTAQTAELIQ